MKMMKDWRVFRASTLVMKGETEREAHRESKWVFKYSDCLPTIPLTSPSPPKPPPLHSQSHQTPSLILNPCPLPTDTFLSPYTGFSKTCLTSFGTWSLKTSSIVLLLYNWDVWKDKWKLSLSSPSWGTLMTISLQHWFIMAEKVGSPSLSTSISLWSEKVVSAHLCKPKRGDLGFLCVCV